MSYKSQPIFYTPKRFNNINNYNLKTKLCNLVTGQRTGIVQINSTFYENYLNKVKNNREDQTIHLGHFEKRRKNDLLTDEDVFIDAGIHKHSEMREWVEVSTVAREEFQYLNIEAIETDYIYTRYMWKSFYELVMCEPIKRDIHNKIIYEQYGKFTLPIDVWDSEEIPHAHGLLLYFLWAVCNKNDVELYERRSAPSHISLDYVRGMYKDFHKAILETEKSLAIFTIK